MGKGEGACTGQQVLGEAKIQSPIHGKSDHANMPNNPLPSSIFKKPSKPHFLHFDKKREEQG